MSEFLYMPSEPDDLQFLISKYRTMDIEELKANINEWEEKGVGTKENHILSIAKNELQLRYLDKQEQIRLLTNSLTSSSRIDRWISSARAVIKQFIEIKN
tara:strand:+ start:70 stop:369 length:300 start_codon:yes stop_codon:yes gene_type:complete